MRLRCAWTLVTAFDSQSIEGERKRPRDQPKVVEGRLSLCFIETAYRFGEGASEVLMHHGEFDLRWCYYRTAEIYHSCESPLSLENVIPMEVRMIYTTTSHHCRDDSVGWR